MAALERLLDGILARWSIPPAGVIAHSDMAPGRKADPGPKLDWRRLARGGRAVWAEGGAGAAPGWPAFAAAAEAAGYAAPDGDWPTVLAAARLRWRPWATAGRASGRRTWRAPATWLLGASALTGGGFPLSGQRADGRTAAGRKARGKSGLRKDGGG